MSRRTRTLLPAKGSLLKAKVVKNAATKIRQCQARQAFYYDRTARDLPELKEGARVRVAPVKKHQEWSKATVVNRKGRQSYEVVTERGQVL